MGVWEVLIPEEMEDVRDNAILMRRHSISHIDQLGSFLVDLTRCSIRPFRCTQPRDTMFNLDLIFPPSCPRPSNLNLAPRRQLVKSIMALIGLTAPTIHIDRLLSETVVFFRLWLPSGFLWSTSNILEPFTNLVHCHLRTILIWTPFHRNYWERL